MVAKTILVLTLFAAVVSIGCASGQSGAAAGPISSTSRATTEPEIAPVGPTWVDAAVEGDKVYIPAVEVDSGKMLHFRVTTPQTSQAFMAYRLGEDTYVRANICPPCRSVGFSLAGNSLVCNSCGTQFEASTGRGISGACRDYPKAEVSHVVVGEKVTMAMGALVTAYENTQRPGLP